MNDWLRHIALNAKARTGFGPQLIVWCLIAAVASWSRGSRRAPVATVVGADDEALAESVQKMMPKLREKHGQKAIDKIGERASLTKGPNTRR